MARAWQPALLQTALLALVVIYALETGRSATRAIAWLSIAEIAVYAVSVLILGRFPNGTRLSDNQTNTRFDNRLAAVAALFLAYLAYLALTQLPRVP